MEQAIAQVGTYGPYLLEATDRKDLQSRVDILIEDRRFHDDILLFVNQLLDSNLLDDFTTLLTVETKEVPDWTSALGLAAQPSLYKAHLCLQEIVLCMSDIAKQQEIAIATGLPTSFSEDYDPLAFLSDTATPVPIAQALLSMFRVNALQTAVGTVLIQPRNIEPWLGLAIAESLAENSRSMLALFAAITGADLPISILPPEERLDIQQLVQQGHALRDAYEQFHADAERSGESVYPSAR
ncbi:hypothetical protein OWM54_23880 [Myxococcus sp. MISCRS1]|uniref:hypothetical protein n=1 Tax=Myxococcus sp. MISCRS1 TaxID=2996786 RepID=UPI00226D9B53|nr:hypothetical protein [Myxococcus sp. MISCRS1]MCY1000183.1 hypothetical protein [Myxococcus sp. MISCRS1]